MEKAYKLEFQLDEAPSLSLNSCGCSKTEPLHSFGPAIKPSYLIHYILSGKGRFVIGGKEYELEAGSGFFIPPNELAFYEADQNDPWTYLWVGFRGVGVEKILGNMGLSVSHPIFQCADSEQLYEVVKDMMQHNTYGIANELRRSGQLGIFLSILSENVQVSGREEQDKANIYVKKAVEFIQENYCNPIKVTDVAEYVCINRSYLYTLFLNSMHISPQQYLSVYRLSKAAELLLATRYSIETIAISCGYTDPLVFSKAFRQMKGVSPSMYRKIEGEAGMSKEQLAKFENFIETGKESN